MKRFGHQPLTALFKEKKFLNAVFVGNHFRQIRQSPQSKTRFVSEMFSAQLFGSL